MGINVQNKLSHWNYYLALEQDLIKVSRYIEFDEANFNTYSIELAHLLLAASSEVDVVAKILCKLLDETNDYRNINDYRQKIKDGCPEVSDRVVYSDRYALQLTPWINWQGTENPDWWRCYNNVKHQRDENYSEANLKNVLNALAALKVLIVYMYKAQFEREKGTPMEIRDVTYELVPKPSLFSFSQDDYYQELMV
ncbi:hypothetical protein HJ179_21125 [Vibrio parahaemolyticus]|uniref:hypothetical protein n=1 Tax=Vibrio vulnificus TaxID=672 RepID=UPI001029F56C|nr:hypothetical protein [Vibrio vulnificus]EGQ7993695.1 hypothetical protein [Vibrio vulnificus]EJO3996020.1 hypothetical protein [Vibrio vulnificus]MBE3825734.1 hypothetical protein [Vibrio parahaemolyticus]RZQ11762.1 hypothetical protein D8T39_08050 [Vibrio vulnificus]